jgi:hypothetical protein
MDKTIWQKMSKNNKSYDKTLSKISYRSSAVLRPLDNALCALYEAQPREEEKDLFQSYKNMEAMLLHTRILLVDSLSYINDQRRELALKSISPSYSAPSESQEVFGEKLHDIIQKENAKNRLLNDAERQRRFAQSNNVRGFNSNYRRGGYYTPTPFRGRARGKSRGNFWPPPRSFNNSQPAPNHYLANSGNPTQGTI